MKHPEILVAGCPGRPSTRCALLAVTLLLAVPLGSATRADAQQPVVIDIGTLGGTISEARDVNDNGQVVGFSRTSGDVTSHAFSWTATGGMVDLGTLGTLSRDYSVAVAVNDKGQVVGRASVSFFAEGMQVFAEHGFSWTATGGMVDLGRDVVPLAVNNAGEVFGYYLVVVSFSAARHAFSWTASGGFVGLGLIGSPPPLVAVTAASDSGDMAGYIRAPLPPISDSAFRWSPTTGTVSLGTLGGASSSALAISPSGAHVVGDSEPGTGAAHGFLWTPTGGMVDVGTIAGPLSRAHAVSDTGQVVGSSSYAPGPITDSHAFSWTATGGMVDLGTLGGSSSYASAVNVNGVVVGQSTTIPGQHTPLHAMSWTAGGGMIDLGALVDGDSSATLVNNRGQVVGVSYPPGTTLHRATMWLPPLPSPADAYLRGRLA